MKNIKYILAGVFFTFSLLVLVVTLLFSFNVLRLDMFRSDSAGETSEIDDSDSYVETDEDEESDSDESEIPWIDYDYDYVSFSAPEDWELYDELHEEGDEDLPVIDVRLVKDDYMIRFFGYAEATGGGFGAPFDGLCGVGRDQDYTTIDEMFTRVDEYVNFGESSADPSCNISADDASVDVWLGSKVILYSENYEGSHPNILNYRDVFGEYNSEGVSPFMNIMLLHLDFIDLPSYSEIELDDPVLMQMQSEFDEVVETVVLKDM